MLSGERKKTSRFRGVLLYFDKNCEIVNYKGVNCLFYLEYVN
jgi:hypothetical protein